MRQPSRKIPSLPKKSISLTETIMVVSFLAGLIALIYFYPLLLIVLGLIIVGTLLINERDRTWLEQLAASRQSESICSFARSFDCRSVDTWIVRAVYEQLQDYYAHCRIPFPFRPTDRIDEDLRLDREDLEDICAEIAYRTGRSMKVSTENPMCGKVKTVGDIVSFFMHQPRTRNV